MCALPKSLLIRLLVLVGIVWSISVDTSVAQMFGPRQIGSPISPRSGPSTAGGTGTLRNQRFLRGNRSRSNFVGTDRTESRQFVGLQQSTGGGSTRSAVAGLGTGGDPSTQLNQVYPRTGTGVLYAPRFEVEFGHGEIAAREISAQLTQRLARLSNSIEVSVEDRVATLRGEVADAEYRRMAEILAGFEPGISSVRNELRVAGDSSTTPPPPPSPTPTQP